MNELVVMNNQQAVTTSLSIAENFGKKHKHVLEAIDELKEGVAENWADLFQETTYVHPQNKQEYRQYYMNRDGFTLIAMGFTGKKALEFKLKYIEAFNEMEKQLMTSQVVPTNMIEALELALEQQKQISMQNQVIGELKPKADYTDRILKNKSLMTITQIAKDYGMSGHKMNALLHGLGIQYKQSGQWFLYSHYHDKGYTHSQTTEIPLINGMTKTVLNTKWTQKGRLFLYEVLKKNDILPMIEREERE